MKRVSPQMRDLAKQMWAIERPGKESAEADDLTAFRAVDRLRPHLSTLMGRSGFQALLARALVLATTDVAWLAAVQVTANGELEGLTPENRSVDAAPFFEGEVALLAHLLGLLDTFIGSALTLRLISELWPQLSVSDTDFGSIGTNGKPNEDA